MDMAMSSFYKKLAVVVGFTLALLVMASNGQGTLSFGGSAVCDSNTGVACTSGAVCISICKQKAGPKYVYGYCTKEDGGGGANSCVCAVRCRGEQSTPPLEKPAIVDSDGADDVMARDRNAELIK